jgi:hypothetical protein
MYLKRELIPAGFSSAGIGEDREQLVASEFQGSGPKF